MPRCVHNLRTAGNIEIALLGRRDKQNGKELSEGDPTNNIH